MTGADMSVEVNVWCSRCGQGERLIEREMSPASLPSPHLHEARMAAKKAGWRIDPCRLWVCPKCWTKGGSDG